jgi:predicted GNAT family N-acyltransferase/predicted nucleic acid-binding protein
MSAPRYLIDTNVFIGLEDHAEVAPVFASLLQLASTHGVEISVHEAAIDDIRRDSDVTRREVSLSKIRKFPAIAKVIGRTKADLEAKFGSIKRPNDLVDSTLLDALEIGVADFLVTQDQGLHGRAMRFSATLADRVLYVADAVTLLRTTYEPIKVVLPSIREVQAHMIPQDDPIFATLRDDYAPFDEWWRDKCVKAKRPCWIAMDGDAIAGLLVRKDETRGDTSATLPGTKIMKICTFKVRPESRGIKLGELLLKQALWHAQTNRHDVVYLTTFPKQRILIDLLEYYGFKHTHDIARRDGLRKVPLAQSLSASRRHLLV